MAEFQKVMREWKRMCKSRGDIPDDYVGAESALLFAFDRPEEIERLVMEWSEEHPEPVYPTWGEWFVQTGDLPQNYGTTEFGLRMAQLLKVMATPIPADNAQKLGIEPKEST